VRNVYEVLREKEDAIERVRREVEALRSVTPLLVDKLDARLNVSVPSAARWEVRTETVSELGEALRTVAPLLADETEDLLAKVRARLVEAAENDSKLGRAKTISRQLRQIAAPLLGANLG
jgi:hypothetical protein